MIQYLTTYFHPTRIESGYSLAISAGLGGARLSHNHERQYTYALQTLTLWSEIMSAMFKLWMLAESDMLHVSAPGMITCSPFIVPNAFLY